MIAVAVIVLLVCVMFFGLRRRLRQLPLPYYEGRHVVITGCDTGFGHMLAKELDARGLSVFAGCLTNNGEEELKKSCSRKLRTFPLDVSDPDSIKKALLYIKAQLPDDTGIWALVNNAGIAGSVGPVDWLTRRDYEVVMSVNLYGMIDMTNACLPLLRKEKGRVVNMTSICGRITLAPTPYCASKYAAEAYSDCLRRDLYKEGISVHVIEPGYFATNMTNPDNLVLLLQEAYNRCDPEVKEYYGKGFVEQAVGSCRRRTRSEKIRGELSSIQKKTLQSNKGAAKVFKEYLQQKGESVDFEAFDNAKLDECLGHFYMDLKKVDGSHYKVNSLEGIRQGLNRHLKSPPFNKKCDIIKDPAFTDSNTCFKAVLAETKRVGKGDVQHYPIISEPDIQKLYTSMHLSIHTPQGLFNKVQFDVRMFFCRRGNENMHGMTKNTFKVFTDDKTGRKYVDELTKNHKIDKESSSGIMPEVPGSIFCPVLSYEMYISKLHPECDKL